MNDRHHKRLSTLALTVSRTKALSVDCQRALEDCLHRTQRLTSELEGLDEQCANAADMSRSTQELISAFERLDRDAFLEYAAEAAKTHAMDRSRSQRAAVYWRLVNRAEGDQT
jgi:hypothetical protein